MNPLYLTLQNVIDYERATVCVSGRRMRARIRHVAVGKIALRTTYTATAHVRAAAKGSHPSLDRHWATDRGQIRVTRHGVIGARRRQLRPVGIEPRRAILFIQVH